MEIENEKFTDLDILLPEDNIVSFTAADGKKYQINLFIPFAVGQMLVDNADDVMEIFGGKTGKPNINAKTIKLALRILTGIMQDQHPHMTDEWIKKNVSVPRMGVILFKAAMPIYDFLARMGELKGIMKTPTVSDLQ